MGRATLDVTGTVWERHAEPIGLARVTAMRPTTRPAPNPSGSVYTVEGLTCAACLAELIESVRLLPHVTGVGVELVVDGRSSLIVEANAPVHPRTVLACVERAGFRGRPTGKRRARQLQQSFTRNAQGLHGRPATESTRTR